MKRAAWFGPRDPGVRLAIGVVPVRWQGWLAALAFLAVLVGATWLQDPVLRWGARGVAALIFLLIVRLTYSRTAEL